jgi:hypothetical protein
MSTIDIKIKATQLGLDLENLGEELEEQFQEDIKNLAQGAYAQIIASVQAKGGAKASDYLKGLTFDVIGENTYLISLEGSYPNKIEDGWQAYDMREAMLKSQKIVQIGTRTGQPWVQISKKGHKYAHVPMEKKPFSRAAGASDMAAAIRGIQVQNQAGDMQKITKIFTDTFGKPLQGKVAVAKNIKGLDKNLNNLVKYQQILKDKSGKERVASAYLVYRTISENGKAWKGPAFEGIKAFIEAEKWLDTELENVLKAYLK